MSPIGQMLLSGLAIAVLSFAFGYAAAYVWRRGRAVIDRSRARKGSQWMKRR